MRTQAPRGQGHHQQSATTRVLSCTSSPVRLRDFHRIGGCLSWQKTFDSNPTMAPPAAGKGHQRTKKRVNKRAPYKEVGRPLSSKEAFPLWQLSAETSLFSRLPPTKRFAKASFRTKKELCQPRPNAAIWHSTLPSPDLAESWVS